MKILAEQRLRQYELTYLLPVSLTSDESRGVHEKVVALVKKHKGTVISTEEWGKKTLAYKIKKDGKTSTEAIYTHLVLEFPAEKITAFEQEVGLEPLIIRHLLVIASDPAPVVEKEVSKE